MAITDIYPINYTDPLSGSFVIQPYTTNGTISPTSEVLDDKAVSAATSLLFYGKGSPGYGERLQENIVHLLENFSGATPPVRPISGQLWFSTEIHWINTTTNTIFVWNTPNGVWESQPLTNATIPPSIAPATGDPVYWFNSNTNKLYYWDGGRWLERIARIEPTDPGGALPKKVLKVYDGITWNSIESNVTIPSNFVKLEGDVMNSGAVLDFANNILINEGNGNIGTGPDIRMTDAGLITTNTSIYFHINDNAIFPNSHFTIASGTRAVNTGETPLFRVYASGLIRQMINSDDYITLMSDDRDIPNKKYVDDLVGSIITSDGVVSGGTFSNGTLTLNRTAGLSNISVNISDTNIPFNDSGFAATNVHDAIVEAAGGADGVVSGGTFSNGTLTLNRTGLSDVNINIQDTSITFVNTGFTSNNVHDAIIEAANKPVNINRSTITTTSSTQTTYTVPLYTLGANSMWVFINGVKQSLGDGYTELNSTQIQLTTAAPVGSLLEFLSFG